MTKRGPRKTVTKCERIGDHGEVIWYVELECGHSLSRSRKSDMGDKLSCVKCSEATTGSSMSVVPASDFNPFDEIKTISKIAAHFNVRMDQVQIGHGMASIYIDAEEIRRITGQ